MTARVLRMSGPEEQAMALVVPPQQKLATLQTQSGKVESEEWANMILRVRRADMIWRARNDGQMGYR